MEPRKDAQYDVKIASPDGILISLSKTDYDTAHSACKALLESTKDEYLKKELQSAINSFGFMGFSGAGYSIDISAKLPRTKGTEPQTCPRRMKESGPWKYEEGLDTWDKIGDDEVCSFCGSLKPSRVIELIKEHGFGLIERSTKTYKWYLHRKGVPNSSFGGFKYYRMHDTDEFISQYNELLDKAKNESVQAN